MLEKLSNALVAGLLCALAAAAASAGCTVREQTPRAASVVVQAPEPADETASSTAVPNPAQPSSEIIPIHAEDAIWGSPDAPVTLVEFTDLQCPFCARALPTLEALKQRYGPDKLRIVVKHNPLPFHKDAKEAARFAQAIQRVNGSEAFFAFAARVLTDQRQLDRESLLRKVSELGLDAGQIAQSAAAAPVQEKVEGDIALAAKLGATGTPSFFVNGKRIAGARPLDDFVQAVDAELARATELREAGMPKDMIYAARVAQNYAEPPPASEHRTETAPDLTVWKVPVTGAPSEGPADAPVTIVAFYDYECPFCKRVQETIQQLRSKYPKDVRIVVRHHPLGFHPRARPAATLAIEARAQRGDAGFFEAQRRLFESQPNLEDADLIKIAADMKLQVGRVTAALKNDKHKLIIEDDAALALDFEAKGTPHFFINGVRLSGARPLSEFEAAVERELAKARELTAKGVARNRLYAELTKDAKGPRPPDRKEVSAPTAQSPTRGPKNAKLVVQIFSDFECPFCKRVLPTLKELEQRYPGNVRFVWRHLPLAFHRRARAAARAAMEARAQKGDAGFWQMHDLLFEDQKQLGDDDLKAKAAKLGLDLARFEAALSDGRHDAAIDHDLDAAQNAGINGTPAFVINGYYLAGAQSISAFRRVAEYALKHPVQTAATP